VCPFRWEDVVGQGWRAVRMVGSRLINPGGDQTWGKKRQEETLSHALRDKKNSHETCEREWTPPRVGTHDEMVVRAECGGPWP